MAIKPEEPAAVLDPQLVRELRRGFLVLGLDPFDAVQFTIFAVTGMWQARFQELGTKLVEKEIDAATKRIARAVAAALVNVPRVRPSRRFDRLAEEAMVVGQVHDNWAREFQETGTGVLDRAARTGASERDQLRAATWWFVRQRCYPKRNIGKMIGAAKYAHSLLELDTSGESLRKQLNDMREALVSSGSVYRHKDGTICVGGRDLRDQISKHQGVPRPRPDRVRKRQEAARKVGGAQDSLADELAMAGRDAGVSEDEEDSRPWTCQLYEGEAREDAESSESAVESSELADLLVRWARAMLKRAKKGSARRAVLSFMIRHPDQQVPVREIARKAGLDPAAISRARKSLLLNWQSFRKEGGPI